MFGADEKRLKKFFNTWLCVSSVGILVCVSKKQFQASASSFLSAQTSEDGRSPSPSLPRPVPSPTPLPTVPLPTRPVTFPSVTPQDQMWVLSGDLQLRDSIHSNDAETLIDQSDSENDSLNVAKSSYTCRVVCKKEWGDLSFEILQSTRGGEDWTLHQNHLSRCVSDDVRPSETYLTGGHWRTPAQSPEDTLCFLVVRRSR